MVHFEKYQGVMALLGPVRKTTLVSETHPTGGTR
jgi:hypothetical protein